MQSPWVSAMALNDFVAAAAAVGRDITPAQMDRLEAAAMWLAQLGRGSGISGYDTPDLALMRGMAPALA